MMTLLTKKEDIIAWLDHNEIKKYNLKPDAVYGWCVDVQSSIYLQNRDLKSFPVKFNHVEGHFYCGYNQLATLEEGPNLVRYDFYCNHNVLTNLKGCAWVGGSLNAYNNRIDNIEDLPMTLGRVNLQCNPLPSQYQDIDNYDILKSLIEKDKINQQIQTGNKPAHIHKL